MEKEEELYRLLGMTNPRGNDREIPEQLKKMFGLEDKGDDDERS